MTGPRLPRLSSLLCLLAWLALGASGSAAGLERYLVAHWTVRDGALQSEPPDLPFVEGNPRAAGPAGIADGLLRLGTDHLLMAREMNPARFPALAGGVTIWARLRLDGLAPVETAFLFGLADQDAPAEWKSMALAVLYHATGDTPGFGPFATLDSGASLGVGPSRLLPAKAGEDLTVGLAFDGISNTVTLWVNGASVSQSVPAAAATRLKAFQCLSLGRLKGVGAVPVSFREVRVYSVPLPPEWIGEVGADDPAN